MNDGSSPGSVIRNCNRPLRTFIIVVGSYITALFSIERYATVRAFRQFNDLDTSQLKLTPTEPPAVYGYIVPAPSAQTRQ